jgi:hypothetical protein
VPELRETNFAMALEAFEDNHEASTKGAGNRTLVQVHSPRTKADALAGYNALALPLPEVGKMFLDKFVITKYVIWQQYIHTIKYMY